MIVKIIILEEFSVCVCVYSLKCILINKLIQFVLHKKPALNLTSKILSIYSNIHVFDLDLDIILLTSSFFIFGIFQFVFYYPLLLFYFLLFTFQFYCSWNFPFLLLSFEDLILIFSQNMFIFMLGTLERVLHLFINNFPLLKLLPFFLLIV